MRQYFVWGLAILLLAAGCAGAQKAPSRDAFILLLPDDQGKTGSIVVSGAGGRQVLSAPREAVRVSAGAPPGKPFVIAEDEVRMQAGAALSALPSPPARFILYFQHDSDKLTRESLARILPEVIRTIRERAPVDVSVVGHTDTVGDRPYNYDLSFKRAQAVARLLAETGLESSVIEITSHGKDNPLVPTGDQVSEPRNRRVEVTVR
jgi:outer membrane protein OmpA-like peptidoglycan-associated protein